MKTLFSFLGTKNYRPRGFILPFTMLISSLILLVTGTAMFLLSKQMYFSKVYRQSQTAYYAADDAIACALSVDDEFIGSDGLGIFPSSTSTPWETYVQDVIDYVNTARLADDPLAPIIDTSNLKCGQVAVFDVVQSSFATSTSEYVYHYSDPISGLPKVEYGIASIYNVRMPLGDGTFRCARVTVNKTETFRQIIAQGYAQCDNPNGTVERAVVNTTVTH